MKIATYNLWNTTIRWPKRLDAACEELTRVSADIVALQEVPASVTEKDPRDAAQYLADCCGYEHLVISPYPDDPEEGLAFLSRYPFSYIEASWKTPFNSLGNCGLRVRIETDGVVIALTNLHLDSTNIAIRETQICGVLERIESQANEQRYEILLGDFNCPPDSSVYRFLSGQQTLRGKSIEPWYDLARYHAEMNAESPSVTLDTRHNPRWREFPALDTPMRFDWILLQDLFDWTLPHPQVFDAGVFGTKPTPQAQVVPSDHYGVYAKIKLPHNSDPVPDHA